MKNVDQQGRTKLLFYVKDNHQDFDGMKRKDVAIICSEALGYDFQYYHIKDVREKLAMIDAPLWKESRTISPKKDDSTNAKEDEKWKKSVEKQFEEQDKKLKILFAKFHSLSNYPPANNNSLTPMENYLASAN